LEAVAKMKQGNVSPIRQDHSQATYAPSLRKEDGRIDWRREAREIDRQVRAFNPWPGAHTSLNERILKIFRGEVREEKAGDEAGRILWVGTDIIEVGTGKGSFLIREVQLEGKRRMTVRELLAGHNVTVGDRFQ
jgi:methionyl-tRNA formyltransferase